MTGVGTGYVENDQRKASSTDGRQSMGFRSYPANGQVTSSTGTLGLW